MKKIYFLLLLAGLLSFANAHSQTTACAANFTFVYQANGQVQFTSTSYGINGTPVDSFFWRFGDGTTSNVANPAHQYTNNGTYPVLLKIFSQSAGFICTDSTVLQVTIQNISCNLVSNFISTQTSPANFTFTNTSTPISPTDSVRWSFGDGSTAWGNNNTVQHTYSSVGTYTVCLRIQKRENGVPTNCFSDTCHTIIVTQNSCGLSANFQAERDSTGTMPDNYFFLNASLNAAPTDSIRWIFGDGTTGTGFNTSHIYAQPGIYNACLRIIKRNPNGTLSNCISEFAKQ